jgi:hypothetical protein
MRAKFTRPRPARYDEELVGAVMSRKAALQTYHALQASELAAAVNEALRKIRLVPGEYAAELTEPEGPSTGGGLQAMQHMRLVPRLAGHPTLVVGHANQTDKMAELRTYDHLDAVHRQRFKRPLAIDRTQYDDFVTLAKGLLEALQFRTLLVGPPADVRAAVAAAEPAAQARPSRSGSGMLVGSVMVAVALVAVGIWMAVAR